jgi:hypothetical protein
VQQRVPVLLVEQQPQTITNTMAMILTAAFSAIRMLLLHELQLPLFLQS